MNSITLLAFVAIVPLLVHDVFSNLVDLFSDFETTIIYFRRDDSTSRVFKASDFAKEGCSDLRDADSAERLVVIGRAYVAENEDDFTLESA